MATTKSQRYLGIAFLLTLVFCFIEFIGARISGSLALMADAGHMMADTVALGLALCAAWIAAKQPTRSMSYGYHRIEVLSALMNAALLLAIAFGICREAYDRMAAKPFEIHSGMMLAVSGLGLLVNLFIGFLLGTTRREDINVQAAFYHVLSDALSSVGVLVAAIVVMVTGWKAVDPVVSVGIACLITVSAWRLLKNVVPVLMEAAPSHINIAGLEKKVLSVPGVRAIHDLHIWSIAPGKDSLSAHIEVEEQANQDDILREVSEVLRRNFQIHHSTLQIEKYFESQKRENHFHA